MPILSPRADFAEKARRFGFKVTNFIPATGIGLFDANYDLGSSTLNIVLRLFFTWRNLPDREPWTAADRDTFMGTFIDVVEASWSDCYTIAADKEGWRDLYARVKVKVEPVSTRGAAHYGVNVSNFAYGETSGAGIERNSKTLSLGRWDVVPEDKISRDKGALEFKIRQVDEKIDQAQARYLAFPQGSSNVPADAAAAVARFCTSIRSIVNPDVIRAGFAIYVYGKKADNETGVTNLTTAKNRAKAVATLLSAHLPPGTVRIVESAAKEPWIVPKVNDVLTKKGFAAGAIASRSFPGVILLVKDPGRAGSNLQVGMQRRYIVAVHECGHMFGLPDEYFGVNCVGLKQQVDMSSFVPQALANLTAIPAAPDAGRAAQAEGMANLLKATGVPSPVFLASTSTVTTSIMYAGSDVLPAHYLPFWQALLNMTYPALQPNEWKIVPNKAGEGKASNVELFAH